MNTNDLGIDLPRVDQIGVVVEDLKSSMDNYGAMLGIEPWEIHCLEPPKLSDTTYRGEEQEYGMLAGLAELGNISIELIEPTIGPNIYFDHLRSRGEGLHHIAYFGGSESETYSMMETLEEAGISAVQSGSIHETEFWYFDTTKKLDGVVFEVAIRRNSENSGPVAVYPNDDYPY